jgi:ATPase subunit of ABC transporter with duplicated ATPase domains
VLRLDNLSKRYDDYLVFQGLTHCCFMPGCVALCEEDSTGKSTLLNLIAGRRMAEMCG